MPKKNAKGVPPKGTPPKARNNNLSKPAQAELVPMNFKVSPEFAKDFKVYAAMHGLKLVDLLKLGFEAYKKNG